MPETLDFEEPIAPLLKQLEELTALPKTDSVQREIEALRRKIDGIRADVYASLTPWQLEHRLLSKLSERIRIGPASKRSSA